jgi:hypothetical protein
MSKNTLYLLGGLLAAGYVWKYGLPFGLGKKTATNFQTGKPASSASTNPLTGAKTEAELAAATRAKEQETIQAGIKAGSDVAKSLFDLFKPQKA